MRSVIVVALLLALVTPPALAQQTGGGSSLTPESRTDKLDRLFGELKRARSEASAQRISNRLREELAASGSASIDLMMGWAKEAMQAEKYDVALDFLDQVTVLTPDYAEAWNQRATVHYAMDNYAKSMSDISRTLQLEPRHFGALGGMAMILTEYDRKEAAMRAYERVLEVYPMLRSAQTELGKLAEDTAGRGI